MRETPANRYPYAFDGAAFRRLRESRSLTQEKLAVISSGNAHRVMRQQIARMESGQFGQGVVNFHDIAEGLGMTMDELWVACVKRAEAE